MKDEREAFQLITESLRIAADPGQVWDAIMDRNAGERWRNAHFATDWRIGGPIEIEAVIGEKRYRDKGHVIRVEPPSRLAYSYWSLVSGLPDRPESYSIIDMTLVAEGGATVLTVTQQVPPSPVRRGNGWEIGAESGAKHAAFYWRMALPRLKRVVEEGLAVRPPDPARG
ncbi:SRPBCC domain-containing protein [Bradyrhizobium sp. WSM 1704]|uniref:SRPBCC family protein n=1 Tax=Bradyrhizobium semiaridum TaxID=2821404 RepID=UPI001CE35AAD|nr:SRPBCC domain-containing protein [Bradyrhizobium semiaridum]MCA6125466.1 SRPBCC domain-containing protein [Bradyrhizobium semiaridum]